MHLNRKMYHVPNQISLFSIVFCVMYRITKLHSINREVYISEDENIYIGFCIKTITF